MELEDYWDILSTNYRAVAVNTPRTILHNLSVAMSGYPLIGGFENSDECHLAEARDQFLSESRDRIDIKYSEMQTRFVLKIYEFCQARGIYLILLNTPTHSVLHESRNLFKTQFSNFSFEKMQKALVVDHSNFNIPDSCYYDLEHLNYSGAKLYTTFLKENRFRLAL